MMGLFMAVMAAVMLLSGAGIDRLNNQKAKNQQAQHAQITCAPESAGTSNEPEQATEQNDEPSLAANCHNDVTELDAASVNNELAQEVDAYEHNDESVQESEVEQRTELTQDMVNTCTDACSQVAVVNGIDSAEALCGAYGVKKPFSFSYTYRKCVKPEAVEGVTAEATKIIGDFTAPLDKKVFYDVNSRETVCKSDVNTLLNDILVSRAMEHGLDMNFARTEWSQDSCFSTEKEIIGPARVSLHLATFGDDLEHALFNVKRVINVGAERWNNQGDCEWLTDLFGAKPFCEANKDFPDCKQFLDIYGKCEKILADATSKSEL